MRALLPGVEPLAWSEHPDPGPPGPGEVRLAVLAAALNRADLLQRAGLYPPPPGASAVLGLECCGRIEALGPGVEGWAIGQTVAALLSGGGLAERVRCPAAHLLPVPTGLSAEEAAALPEAWATAWLNLVVEGDLRAGERLLVHAAASGVGTAAVQLGRLRGARVLGLVGSPEKMNPVMALGAERVLDRHDPGWPDQVRAWAPEGLDLILDPVGGPTLERGVELLGIGGRVQLIGLMGGRSARLDLGRVLVKRLRVQGSTLRSRTEAEKASLVQALREQVWPALEAGRIRPVIAQVLSVEEAQAAYALMESNRTVGKIVLRVSPRLV